MLELVEERRYVILNRNKTESVDEGGLTFVGLTGQSVRLPMQQ